MERSYIEDRKRKITEELKLRNTKGVNNVS